MPDREKVIKAIEICIKDGCKDGIPNQFCPYSSEVGCNLNQILADALAMLKEQEAVVKQWTKEIADNQLANAPNDSPMSLDEQLECEYKRGIWDGLQIAWNIISEGR